MSRQLQTISVMYSHLLSALCIVVLGSLFGVVSRKDMRPLGCTIHKAHRMRGTMAFRKHRPWASIRELLNPSFFEKIFSYLTSEFRWNRFQCNINETLIRQTAIQMKNLGFLDAGYNFMNIDDCWLTKTRGSDGQLVTDPVKFPSITRTRLNSLH